MTSVGAYPTSVVSEPDFWRVRMKVSQQIDHSEAAWELGEVGVWYGAWSAGEWRNALLAQPRDPWQELKELPHQRALEWENTDLSAVRRFDDIKAHDWCVLYLRQRKELALARLEPGVQSRHDHPLNHVYAEGVFETFKYRRISERKSFRIAELPDAYRLLAAQGRANVHLFHAMRDHVRLLGKHPDAAGVRRELAAMTFNDLIDTLGASAWESVCTSYLTLEHGFVPTGLSTGLTLETLDIVGRSTRDGSHILAQCKKHRGAVSIDADFLSAVDAQGPTCKAFFFAFGGCDGDIPAHVHVVGREEMLAWAETEKGSMYRRFLTS